MGAELLALDELWLGTWPIAVGALLFTALAVPAALARVHLRPIVAGDLLVPLERALAARIRPEPVVELPEPAHPVATLGSRWYGLLDESVDPGALARLEGALSRWSRQEAPCGCTCSTGGWVSSEP